MKPGITDRGSLLRRLLSDAINDGNFHLTTVSTSLADSYPARCDDSFLGSLLLVQEQHVVVRSQISTKIGETRMGLGPLPPKKLE
jgi:hypothetical protein